MHSLLCCIQTIQPLACLLESWRFLKGYILRGGIREGFHGFLIAIVGAFEVAIKYAKLRELEINEELASQRDAVTDETEG